MSRYHNFRIILNLSSFFSDHRQKARIFICDYIQTIRDLQDKISKIFQIENFHLSTLHYEFLPPSEDVRLLHDNEILWVNSNPTQPNENTREQSKANTSIKSKKHRTKRKAQFENNDHSSDEEMYMPRKLKRYGEVVERTSKKNKNHKSDDPYVPGVHKLNTNDDMVSAKNLYQAQKLSKRNKQMKLKDIEIDVVIDTNIQSVNKDIHTNAFKKQSVDESSKNSEVIYIKKSPLPTNTEEYLKHAEINLVKINYVTGKPPSEISADNQESAKNIENEATSSQRIEKLSKNDLEGSHANTIPTPMQSSNDKKRTSGSNKCHNKIPEEHVTTETIESNKDQLETDVQKTKYSPIDYKYENKSCVANSLSEEDIEKPEDKVERINSTNISSDNLDQNCDISTSSVANKAKIMKEHYFESSSICLNKTAERLTNKEVDQQSSELSGIHRISVKDQSSNFSESSTDSKLNSVLGSDSCEFFSKKRHKLTKKQDCGLSPILPSLLPLKVNRKPHADIRFNQDGKIENKPLNISSEDAFVDLAENSFEYKEYTLEDIRKAPSMKNIKPKVGNIIAFKLFKINQRYEAVMSLYIIGKVIDYNIQENYIVFDIIVDLNECGDQKEKRNLSSKRRRFHWPNLKELRLLFPHLDVR